MTRKYITPEMEAAYLNQVMQVSEDSPERVIKLKYIEQTERGDEYYVVCADEKDRCIIQHFSGAGITWMWEKDYAEFERDIFYRQARRYEMDRLRKEGK